MAETTKLTKKQKKALEFRNKTGKEGKKSLKDEVEITESTTNAEVGQEKAPSKKSKGKEKQKEEDQSISKSLKEEKSEKKKDTDKTVTNKRKRKDDENKTGNSSKKRFDEEGNVIETETKEEKEPLSSKPAEKESSQKRYIVFVGNMSFKTTSEEITKHFAQHCDEKPNVRLLTKKGDPTKIQALSKSKQKSIAKGKSFDPSAPQSKGCAFVEFQTRNAMQKALQFHHTKLHGRSINVELTAGGGGSGAERKEKIAKKNKELDAERKKIHEKYVKDAKKKDGDSTNTNEEGEKVVEQNKPQWGPNAANNKGKPATKIPRWAATGANAVRLQT